MRAMFTPSIGGLFNPVGLPGVEEKPGASQMHPDSALVLLSRAAGDGALS